jgi:plastocyanin
MATEEASGEAPAGETAATIADFAFSPDPIEIRVGSTVTWTNEDSAPHTATGDNGEFDTGRLDQGGSASVTFDEAGSFTYHCAFHPNMVGTVNVS